MPTTNNTAVEDIIKNWDKRYPNRLPTVEELVSWKAEILKDIRNEDYPKAIHELDKLVYEAITSIRHKQ